MLHHQKKAHLQSDGAFLCPCDGVCWRIGGVGSGLEGISISPRSDVLGSGRRETCCEFGHVRAAHASLEANPSRPAFGSAGIASASRNRSGSDTLLFWRLRHFQTSRISLTRTDLQPKWRPRHEPGCLRLWSEPVRNPRFFVPWTIEELFGRSEVAELISWIDAGCQLHLSQKRTVRRRRPRVPL